MNEQELWNAADSIHHLLFDKEVSKEQRKILFRGLQVIMDIIVNKQIYRCVTRPLPSEIILRKYGSFEHPFKKDVLIVFLDDSSMERYKSIMNDKKLSKREKKRLFGTRCSYIEYKPKELF